MESAILKIIQFASAEDLLNWEKEYQEFKDSKKVVKKQENRGSKTQYLHQQTKAYLIEHPDIKYKSALKIVGKNLKDKNKK